MVKIKRIRDNVWEIPKEKGMKVQGYVFASESLFENMQKDKTIEQVKNMAKLPGVVGAVYAMPDSHQGYGFPIGGVAAFDLDKGVVSPGGVGYDINCLTGDTKILTEFGSSTKIEEFDNCKSEIEVEDNGRKITKILFSAKVPTLNISENKLENKKVNLFMERFSNEVYEITLSSGLKIKATSEHPFFTKEGMLKLKNLSAGQDMGINLFEGFDETERIDPKEAVLAKIIGYLFGDGSFYEGKSKLRAVAYGSECDLKNMLKDLAEIGVNSRIYSRARHYKIQTRYRLVEFNATNHELHIYPKHFNLLLKEKGLISGNKTRKEVKIPEWIKKGSKTIKRLFLAGFFGAEMSSPKICSKTCFFCPTIDQNKIEPLTQNARDFLIEISLLLGEFGIKDTKISEMDDFHNKYGEKTKRFRLFVKNEENMLKLWRTIGYEYNEKRQKLANMASLYILLKKEENKKRQEISKKIKEYRISGLNLKEVQNILSGQINSRFIERHYYENAKQRINLDFISFDDFCKVKFEELEIHGVIFDKIREIKKIDGNFKVYDFNIEDNHNFIANGFVVSNCGVRLLTSDISKEEFMKKRMEIMKALAKNVPSGVGTKSDLSLKQKELDVVLNTGVSWAVEKGFATKQDIENIESDGCILGADASKLSQKAKGRGLNQIGSLGAGNHFVEVQYVENIFDSKTAKTFGLNKKGQITVLIHSGSRGLGHQVASDYIKLMEEKYGFKHLPDRELACAPIKSELGQNYLSAMACAANFGFVNRQLLAYRVREVFSKFFPKSELKLVYDVAHNIAKIETHVVNGKKMKVCVHRKGATRSFGPGNKEIPKKYSKTGQPIFIPGSMGTYSYVLAGTKEAERLTFGSTAHGAGRLLSRSSAVKMITPEHLRDEMNKQDVILEAGSLKGAVEEAPEAYKDVNEVVRVSDELGIGKIVARLKPLGVVKG